MISILNLLKLRSRLHEFSRVFQLFLQFSKFSKMAQFSRNVFKIMIFSKVFLIKNALIYFYGSRNLSNKIQQFSNLDLKKIRSFLRVEALEQMLCHRSSSGSRYITTSRNFRIAGLDITANLLQKWVLAFAHSKNISFCEVFSKNKILL